MITISSPIFDELAERYGIVDPDEMPPEDGEHAHGAAE